MEDLHRSAYFGIPSRIFLYFVATLVTFPFSWKTYSYVAALSQARPDVGVRRLSWRFVLRNLLWLPRRAAERLLRSAELLILWASLAHTVAFFWNLVRETWVELVDPMLPTMEIPYVNEIRPLVAGTRNLVTFSHAPVNADLESRISVKDIAELADERMHPTFSPAAREGAGVC